jgi:2-dehydropantoate 2-reductase
MPFLFSGSEERVDEVINALKPGGLPVRTHPDVETLVGYVLALEAPLIAGLEGAGWSIKAFRRSRWFKVAYGAIKEATEVVSRYKHKSRPAAMTLLNQMTLQLGLMLLPKLRPVPLEAYLKHHFTKLSTQSLQHIDDYIEIGMEYGISVASLRELKEGLRQRAF